MRVKEIMSGMVESISLDDMLVRAAEKMRDLNVGALPVVNDVNNRVGIITDRDMVVRAIANQNNPAATPVSTIMTTDVLTCRAEQAVEEAIQIMEEAQVRRLIVVDDSDQTIGVLSLCDIALKGPGREVTGEAVEAILSP
jgi:CBS domain-containing protein